MRIILALLLVAAILDSHAVQAQNKRAKTDDGKEVILKADGTWSYVGEYNKNNKATLAYTGKRKTFAIYLVPDTWKKMDEEENQDAEVIYSLRNDEVFAFVIAERIQIPLKTLKKLVVEQWQSLDKNAKVVLEEKRTVNGTDILCLTAEVDVDGVPFTYHAYYYSGEAGTIQVVTGTGQNLFKELKPELEEFLNGFVIIQKK